MAQKIQIIIEDYDPEERTIEGTKIDKDSKAKRFREKGLNVEEFKKLIRKKFGDDVEIVNKVKKHRDVLYGEKQIPGVEGKGRDDRFNTKDIIEIMKNKYSD
jgi:hypothetical protein